MAEKFTIKQFIMAVFNGMALGVVTALIANAAISSILAIFSGNPIADGIALAAKYQQFALPLTVGLGIAMQFKLSPIQSAALLLVTYIAAGNIHTTKITTQAGEALTLLTIKGVGDLVNMMIAAGTFVFTLRLIGNKCGSFTIVALPILAAIFAYISTLSYPFFSSITGQFGKLVNELTDLRPLIMGPLVAICFGLAVTTPLSSVGLALVTGVSGLAAGAANLGVNAAVVFLIFGGFKANKAGVPVALFFGSIKLFTPLLLSRPLLLLPLMFTCAFSGFVGALMMVPSSTAAAGFGAVGLIGPIELWSQMAEYSVAYKLGYTLIAYVVVPSLAAYPAAKLASKMNFASQEDWRLKV